VIFVFFVAKMSSSSLEIRSRPQRRFSHKAHEGHEGIVFKNKNFVIFVAKNVSVFLTLIYFDARYAAIAIMSSSFSFATTGFINGLSRVPACMSYSCLAM